MSAAKTGLAGLVGLDSGEDLQEGFQRVLARVTQADVDGLQCPSSRSTKAQRRASAGVPRSSGGGPGASKRAAQNLQCIFETARAAPYGLYCQSCGCTAELGLRGGKRGGAMEYFCEEHVISTGCFLIDSDRADKIVNAHAESCAEASRDIWLRNTPQLLFQT
eukprot:TRINITY_DN272_c0_g3_i1.p2 TRINITY_DN272_c0_g3~~TRINITY_DN272_c0_g3_i1.p2  ORF type:complete len:163 (+),score=19.94 TRINITY_DN272_c0_g3_i1:305-793(+)